MREDIVAEDEDGFFSGRCKSLSDVIAEEFDERFDAFLARDFGDVGGGLDAEARDFGLRKVLEKVAIVTGDFDDVALAVQREFVDIALDGFSGMAKKSIGK
jgi:hypothetical protein